MRAHVDTSWGCRKSCLSIFGSGQARVALPKPVTNLRTKASHATMLQPLSTRLLFGSAESPNRALVIHLGRCPILGVDDEAAHDVAIQPEIERHEGLLNVAPVHVGSPPLTPNAHVL